MNVYECDIIKVLNENTYDNQRSLSEKTGLSLGNINKSITNLINNGYLDRDYCFSNKLKRELSDKHPKNAIILAAGYGMRMVPINTEFPKGLLQVKGEILIERIIRQLHEVGVKNIYIVVGFMKEQYEYLIDKYGVDLIVNSNYALKNNLHSLSLASKYINNTYIIPSDIWCEENPFNNIELYSWYMVTNAIGNNSNVRTNKKRELIKVKNGEHGNKMIGIAYLTGESAKTVKNQLLSFDKDVVYNNSFWEETLFNNNKMIVWANITDSSQVYEIDTFEQLRDIDGNSNSLNAESLSIISKVFNIEKNKIENITVLKKGMTNRSFTFQVKGRKYIMRIPGEGTEQLINRENEAQIYKTINGKSICENILYIDDENGYKITKYLENSRACDAFSETDLKLCMEKLKSFHALKLKVNNRFDLFKQIDFYESLWNTKKSVYRDYESTKKNVLKLKSYVEKYKESEVLTHIDAVPDNFLIDNEKVYLIDWEYAGMQDPHVDIAMFCIYAMYSKEQVDNLIDIYFDNNCSANTRIKIYCYIAICGLLWSNWCEYKQQLGIEFGEYSLRQYRYAKDYFKIATAEMNKTGESL